MSHLLAGTPWFIVSVLALALGVIFIYYYFRTKDEIKIVFSTAYIFASLTFLTHINPEWQSSWILENIHTWGALPIISAVLLVSLTTVIDFTKKTIMKIYFSSILFTIFLLITSIPFPSEIIFQSMALITIFFTAFLFKKRETNLGLMFLLSIICFSVAGVAVSLDLDVLFISTCYVFAFIFTTFALNRSYPNKEKGFQSFFNLRTQLKKTQVELETSKNRLSTISARFNTLLKLIADPVVIVDGKGIFLEINDAVEERTGYTKEELLGINFLRTKMITTKSKALLIKNLAKRMIGVKIAPYEIEVYTKRGEKFPVELNAKKIDYAGKEADLVVFRDITERKELERKLEKYAEQLEKEVKERTKDLAESEEKIRSVFESSPNAITVVDINGLITDCTQATLDIHGFSTKQELIGKTASELIAEEDRDMVLKIMANILEKKSIKSMECKLLKKDGKKFYGEISVSILRDSDHVPIGYVAVSSDISIRKIAEENLKHYSDHLEEIVKERTKQLKQSERMAAIGELATMVAHDLRNPLQGIVGATYYIKSRNEALLKDPTTKKMFELIQKDLNYSDKIVSDLLDYSSELKLDFSSSSVKKLIENSLSMIDVPEKIEIFNFIQEGTNIIVDVEKMTRVFINLSKNAIDAMPDGGRLSFEQSVTDGNLKIIVNDTGSGISPENLANLWKPLFTTKAKGMGFGLTICKRIIETHGGTISVDSQVGEGTTFTIVVPINPIKTGGEKDWMKIKESL